MTQRPLVSIVVPCFKKAKYLPVALDSILAQTYQDWECVIVNDGSPDNTEKIAHKYCQKDSRFHYLYQTNKGVSAARNNGLRQMSGKYILALDADDWISETYIEKAVTRLEENDNIKVVYSRYERFSSEGSGEWELPPYSYEGFLMGDMVIVCSAIYRRADFERVGGYDETLQGFEDWDLWLSILGEHDEVYRLEELLFHYRTDSSIVSRQVSQNERLLRIRLCEKHEDKYKPRYADLLYYYKAYKELGEYERLLERVYASHAYRLGKFMIKPFAWARKKLSL